jgi:hypothetical protein
MAFMLYMTTYFAFKFFNMNDDLTTQKEGEKMDWRIRNLIISYVFFYLCAFQNLLDCVSLWMLNAMIATIIVMDIIESWQLGRSS